MSEQQPGAEDQQKRRPSIGEGIRSGIGVLSAFKEAVEETIQEAVQRGDLKPERAKQFVSDAVGRAQEAVGDVRERLDFVTHREFDELRARVEALEARHGGSAGTLPATGTASTAAAGGTASTGPAASSEASPEGPTEARMP